MSTFINRELDALAKALLILAVELFENPTTAIKDAFGYVSREIITPILASESAYVDFYNKTGKDIRTFDWRSSRNITSKNGEKFSIHKVYTGDHVQTCHDFQTMLRKAYEKGLLTEEFIIEQLKNRYVCWITKEEDRRLNELGYRSNRPDSEKAYREAGIVIYHPLEYKSLELPYLKAFEKFTTAPNENFRIRRKKETESPQKTTKTNVEVQPCTEPVKKSQPQVRKAITYCSKNTFIFKNEKRFNKDRNRNGFITLDNEGRTVAVTAMHKDKRGVAYGQAELCFYDEYKSEFGEWRLVAINKERLSFNKLTNILEANGSHKATIDPRKGS